MAVNERITQLVIRGRDEFSRVLKNLETQQKRAAESGAQAVRKLNLEYSVATKRVLRETEAQIKDLALQFRTLSKAEGDNRAQIAQVVIAKAKLQAKAKELRSSLLALRQSTVGLSQAQKGSFLEFSQAASAMERSTAALRRDGAAAATAAQQYRNLAASQRAVRKQAVLQPTAKEARSSVGAFGLAPWQLVNLGYQMNDVISGLAMGQSPIQVLAQQAGQFVQIWPGVMSGLARAIPIIGKVGIALTPLIIGVTELNSRTKALDEFNRRLSTMADGANYSAEALANISRKFEELEPLVRAGFSEEAIKGFHDLAKTLANANGDSLVENVERLAKAFGGGVEGVRDLDRELNFLTASQLRQMRSMEAQGDRAGALRVAQDALEKSYAQFASKARGPWGRSLENLGKAYKNLKTWLSDTVAVRAVVAVFDRLGRAVEAITAKMRNLTALLERDPTTSTGNHVSALEAELARVDEWRKNSGSFPPGYDQGVYDQLAADLKAARDLHQQITDEQKAHNKEAVLEQQTAEATAKLVDDRLAQLREEGALAVKTAKEQYVHQQILEAQNKARQEGLNLSREQLALIREQAGVTFDAQNSILATGNYGGVVDRIIGIESGGRTDAKNPNSTATGLGQFIESTWLRLFRQHFPDRAESMTREAILALRKDAAISRAMVEAYARENSETLQKAGVAVNDAAVYLAHFLGPQGAINTLRANPDATTDQFLSADQIAANRSILEGKTAREVVAWATRKMAITDQELAVTTRLTELEDERAKKQSDYLKGYQQRLASQQFELELASKAAREAAIAKAIRDEELQAQEAGLQLTREQRDEIARLTGMAFDRQNAELRVNELMERRSQLAESLEIAQAAGDSGKVQQIVEQIGQTEDELVKAIDAAITFYEALGGPAADQAILKLQNLKATVGDTVRELETRFLPSAEELNERIADAGSSAFSRLAEAIANGESAFASFRDAVLQGLGEILIEIGKAIVKQALFNAISGGASGGGLGNAISGAITSLFHGGGIVGGPGSGRKTVDPSIFARASYYHGGGVVDRLGPREVPIIALEGEEVLTSSDPRHSRNGGGGINVKNVNVFDPAEVLEASLATEAGQKVILNFIMANPRRVRQAMGV